MAKGETVNIAELVETFQAELYLPDPTVLVAVVATVAANRLPGDPVWTFVVGPPGGGKTEVLNPIVALPEARALDAFSLAGLLTATAGGEVGGLLANLDELDDGHRNGIAVIRDFSTILAAGAAGLDERFAVLRRLYDGAYDRVVGHRGGMRIGWVGKLGLLAAVTDEIDQHDDQMAALGQRFVYVRQPPAGRSERIALQERMRANFGREREMRDRLAAVTVDFFDRLVLADRPGVPVDPDRLDALTRFVVLARSHVGHRAGGDVAYVNEPEMPTRVAAQLRQLYAGVLGIGLDHDWAMHVAGRVGVDSIPPDRLRAWRAVVERPGSTTEEIAGAAGIVASLAQRALGDLEAHRLVTQDSGLRWAPVDEALADWSWATGAIETSVP